MTIGSGRLKTIEQAAPNGWQSDRLFNGKKKATAFRVRSEDAVASGVPLDHREESFDHLTLLIF